MSHEDFSQHMKKARVAALAHPWYLVTNRHRVLTLYSGGRKGGIHLQVLVDE